MTERVVDVLEVVEIDEQRRHRCLAATRAREHLLDAVQDQRAVREAGQRVVGRQERKLLLAPRELFICSLTLGLKALAHPQKAELEAQLQDVQGLRERLGRDVQLRGALLQHLGHHIAPPETAPGHLVQRRRAVGGQLAEDLPGFPAGLDGHLHALPRDPASYRDRGAHADSFEAVLNQGVDIVVRSCGSLDRQVAHILGPRLQRLAEATEILVPRLL